MEEKTTDAVRGSFSTGVVAVSWRNDDWRRGSGPFWGGMSSSPVVSGFSNRKSTEAGIPKLTRSKAVNGQMTSVKVNSLNGRFAIRSRFARDSLPVDQAAELVTIGHGTRHLRPFCLMSEPVKRRPPPCFYRSSPQKIPTTSDTDSVQ